MAWGIGIIVSACAVGFLEAHDDPGAKASDPAGQYAWVLVNRQAAFAPRDGAGALSFRGRMWLLGGWNPGDKVHFPRICSNEVWSSADGAAWTLEKPNTPWRPRHAASVFVHAGALWMVAGNNMESDVWKLVRRSVAETD